jgi:hypothetical protein
MEIEFTLSTNSEGASISGKVIHVNGRPGDGYHYNI